MGQYNSFIVRVWSDGDGHLHGKIEHVATRESMAFRDLERVIQFMHARLRTPRSDGADLQTWPGDGLEFRQEWTNDQLPLFGDDDNG